MRVRLTLVAAAASLAMFIPTTGHAFTPLAQCSGSASPSGATCTTSFVCPVHTVNLRAISNASFGGTIEVTLDDGTTVTTITSDWFGRTLISGDEWTTVTADPYATCTLTVTGTGLGTYRGRIDV